MEFWIGIQKNGNKTGFAWEFEQIWLVQLKGTNLIDQFKGRGSVDKKQF